MTHRLDVSDRSWDCDTEASRLDLTLQSSSGGGRQILMTESENCHQRDPWMREVGVTATSSALPEVETAGSDQHDENKMDTLSSWSGKIFEAEETH